MRSLRRHQARVARARKFRILRYHWDQPRRIWRGFHRMVMNEPGWWTHEWHIQPARIRTRQLLHLVRIGHIDPEAVQLPDGKKPRFWYW